jgi:hypothetical protein
MQTSTFIDHDPYMFVKTNFLTFILSLNWVRPKKIICVFTVIRPTLIFASDPMHFYTEFG